MSLIWFAKAKGGSCNHCTGFSGVRVRVFGSQAEFETSDYYAGEDQLQDEPGGAAIAVWPGKHNVGRKAEDWWLCVPIHPNCGCGWREVTIREDTTDWFSELSEKEIEKYVTKQF